LQSVDFVAGEGIKIKGDRGYDIRSWMCNSHIL